MSPSRRVACGLAIVLLSVSAARCRRLCRTSATYIRRAAGKGPRFRSRWAGNV